MFRNGCLGIYSKCGVVGAAKVAGIDDQGRIGYVIVRVLWYGVVLRNIFKLSEKYSSVVESWYSDEIVGKVSNFREFNTLSVFQISRWI